MNSQHYIGIDAGLDGGIAELDSAGNLLDLTVMPTVKVGKGRKIDLQVLSDYFALAKIGCQRGRLYTFILEDPGGHAPSAAGLRSMTYCFAAIESLLVANKLRYHTVSARKWQSEFWSKSKMAKGQKFDTKAAALAEAKKLWPGESFRKSERAKIAHDGLIDASLLAEYGRRKL